MDCVAAGSEPASELGLLSAPLSLVMNDGQSSTGLDRYARSEAHSAAGYGIHTGGRSIAYGMRVEMGSVRGPRCGRVGRGGRVRALRDRGRGGCVLLGAMSGTRGSAPSGRPTHISFLMTETGAVAKARLLWDQVPWQTKRLNARALVL